MYDKVATEKMLMIKVNLNTLQMTYHLLIWKRKNIFIFSLFIVGFQKDQA